MSNIEIVVNALIECVDLDGRNLYLAARIATKRDRQWLACIRNACDGSPALDIAAMISRVVREYCSSRGASQRACQCASCEAMSSSFRSASSGEIADSLAWLSKKSVRMPFACGSTTSHAPWIWRRVSASSPCNCAVLLISSTIIAVSFRWWNVLFLPSSNKKNLSDHHVDRWTNSVCEDLRKSANLLRTAKLLYTRGWLRSASMILHDAA